MYFASIEDEKIFEIIVSKWNILTEIVDVLETVYDATIVIQIPHFTLADFFCCWIRINMRLLRHKKNAHRLTDLADLLLENLEIRKIGLLKHPPMLCAIYLDHRAYKELNANEIQIAKTALANLHKRVCDFKSNPAQGTKEDSFNNSLEEYFSQQKEDPSDERAKFMELLDTFRHSLQHVTKEDQQATSFTFWESKKLVFPALYEIACVINAIPPSQATVERAFATLNFVFGDKRTHLNQALLEKILMIKLNAEMSIAIDQRDIDAIAQ